LKILKNDEFLKLKTWKVKFFKISKNFEIHYKKNRILSKFISCIKHENKCENKYENFENNNFILLNYYKK